MANWLLAITPDDFETSRARGFDVAGVSERHRSTWERVHRGDRVLFHLSGADAIAGAGRVTGERYEDAAPIWAARAPHDPYPYRFPIETTAVCEPGDYVPLEPLARELDYVRPRGTGDEAASDAPGSIHELTDADAELLEAAVRLRTGAMPTA